MTKRVQSIGKNLLLTTAAIVVLSGSGLPTQIIQVERDNYAEILFRFDDPGALEIDLQLLEGTLVTGSLYDPIGNLLGAATDDLGPSTGTIELPDVQTGVWTLVLQGSGTEVVTTLVTLTCVPNCVLQTQG